VSWYSHCIWGTRTLNYLSSRVGERSGNPRNYKHPTYPPPPKKIPLLLQVLHIWQKISKKIIAERQFSRKFVGRQNLLYYHRKDPSLLQPLDTGVMWLPILARHQQKITCLILGNVGNRCLGGCRAGIFFFFVCDNTYSRECSVCDHFWKHKSTFQGDTSIQKGHNWKTKCCKVITEKSSATVINSRLKIPAFLEF